MTDFGRGRTRHGTMAMHNHRSDAFTARAARARVRLWKDLLQSENQLREEDIMGLMEERRRWFRVPMGGNLVWRSLNHLGEGSIRDISPGGAAFDLPSSRIFQIGSSVDLDVDLESELRWHVAGGAKVVRKVSHSDGTCEIAVEFPASAESPD